MASKPPKSRARTTKATAAARSVLAVRPPRTRRPSPTALLRKENDDLRRALFEARERASREQHAFAPTPLIAIRASNEPLAELSAGPASDLAMATACIEQLSTRLRAANKQMQDAQFRVQGVGAEATATGGNEKPSWNHLVAQLMHAIHVIDLDVECTSRIAESWDRL